MGRSPSHMITMPSPKRAFQVVDRMKKHDFAFVKRSDGSYSYAILAFRSLEPINDRRCATKSSALDECLTFVVDLNKSIAKIEKEKWVEYIRPAESCVLNRQHSHSQTHINQRDEWAPPGIISFVPAVLGEGDDFSITSR